MKIGGIYCEKCKKGTTWFPGAKGSYREKTKEYRCTGCGTIKMEKEIDKIVKDLTKNA